MKTWRIAAFLLMLLMSTVGQAQQIITVNTNGSFEQSDVTVSGDTSGVEGWTFELQDNAVATFAIIDSVVKDSSRALQISVETAGANEWSIQAINEPFTVIPGNQYNLKVWAKSDVAATANFTVGNPSYDEFARQGSVSLTSEWQEVSLNFSPGATDTVGRAPLHFSFAANEGGTIWIDSLRVTTEIDTTPPVDPVEEEEFTKFLGSAYSNDQAERFTDYWNQVTPENSGKWGSVEGSRNNMNWGQLDEAYNLAKTNGYPFHFHVLIWGAQQPAWMNDLGPEEQLEEIREWFEAVAERYPDIEYLEVVNEPLHQRPDGVTGDADYWEALGGQGETGWDWVIKSFEMAREIFPDSTQLMINDYGIVSSLSSAYQYLNIINLLIDRDLVDIIGVQAHAFSNGSSTSSGTTPSTIRSVLNKLGETGLPIQATELDIDGDPNSNDSDEVQLENYKRIFPVFWEHPKVEGVTLWGWRPGMWRSEQEAFLWSDRGRPRPAMEWLIDYVDTASVVYTVSIEPEIDEIPTGFTLEQNYPNPFNPSTTISYQIPVNAHVTITVYDQLGREVAMLVNEMMSAGNHATQFDARNLSSGVYYYMVKAGDMVQTKAMTLIK